MPIGAHFRPVGTTDSERAFCCLLDRPSRDFGAAASPSWQELAPAIARTASQVGRHGAFNFLLSDGPALDADASTAQYFLRRQHPFPVARLVDRDESIDLAAHHRPGEVMTVVVIEPLTRNEPWTAFAPGELRVFVDGAQVHRQASRPAPRPAAAPAQTSNSASAGGDRAVRTAFSVRPGEHSSMNR